MREGLSPKKERRILPQVIAGTFDGPKFVADQRARTEAARQVLAEEMAAPARYEAEASGN